MENPSPSPSPNESVFSQESKIAALGQTIDWEVLSRSGVIDQSVAQKLNLMKEELFQANAESQITTIFIALEKVHTESHLSYLLTYLDNILEKYPETCKLINELTQNNNTGITYEALKGFLNNSDVYIRARAYNILSLIMKFASETFPVNLYEEIMRNIKNNLSSSNQNNRSSNEENTTILISLNALENILSVLYYRYLFIEEGNLHLLVNLLDKKGSDPQIVYDTLFCIWLCSFSSQYYEGRFEKKETNNLSSSSSSSSSLESKEKEEKKDEGGATASMPLLEKSLHLVPSLMNILKSHQKEKVIRIALAIIRNLLQGKGTKDNRLNRATNKSTLAISARSVGSSSDSNSGMSNLAVNGSRVASRQLIENGCVKILHHLLNKQTRDEELKDNLNFVSELLNSNEDAMCSFEAYQEEVSSGTLTWSPPHLSEKFWRENWLRFEGDNFKVIRDVVSFLYSSNKVNLPIACRDIGNFAIYHPRGRSVIESFNVKDKIIELMSNEDPQVQKEALLCIQKLLTQKWNVLQNVTSKSSMSSTSSGQTTTSSASSVMKNPLAAGTSN